MGVTGALEFICKLNHTWPGILWHMSGVVLAPDLPGLLFSGDSGPSLVCSSSIPSNARALALCGTASTEESTTDRTGDPKSTASLGEAENCMAAKSIPQGLGEAANCNGGD